MFLALCLFGVLDAETLNVVAWAHETIELVGAAVVMAIVAGWVWYYGATADDVETDSIADTPADSRTGVENAPPPFV